MASDRDTLPSTFKAANYKLAIDGITFAPDWSYQGHVCISGAIAQQAREVVLNSHQLKIHDAEIKSEVGKSQSSIKTTNVEYSETDQRAKLLFDQEFPSSQNAELIVRFQGTMNNTMAGFYRSKYKPAVEPSPTVPQEDKYHYMFSTQFESCDARRAFPCFDEPNLKASFEFSIEIPEDQTALSNMPEKEVVASQRAGDHKWKVVHFEKSPVMSTYLYAWAFGDFEYVEATTERKYNGKKLPVRVYTTRGLKRDASWALENAWKIIDLFSEKFQIDYPLPKSDILAVHEFSHNAMENWGLVTYRTTAVLFDEKNSDQKYRTRVAYVVSHELAHQWFGNLVTMDWWSELWLNEGFATWVGWYAMDVLYPDWKVWGQFVSESMYTAFNLDSIRSSHPIEVPVRNALEVDQIFDAISYLKGCSIIRMLSAHIGEDVFLQGVANYLKKHAYGNARTEALWTSLSEVSGQNINQMMDAWIQKIGHPVLTIAEEPGQITIQQNRFLQSGDVKSEEDETTWWIPLGLMTKNQQGNASTLTTREDTIRDVDDSFYKLNKNSTGFYRVNYPPERLIKLGEAKAQLSIEDRIGLISDAAALAKSGNATTPALLSLAESFADESDYLVWSSVLTSIGGARSVFADEKVSPAFSKFVLKLVGPTAEKIGWEFKPNESLLAGQLRALLISQAGLSGHAPTIKVALEQFDKYMGGDTTAIHASLRGPVFRIAIKERGASAYEAVKNEFLTTRSIDGQEICLQAMGRVQTAELARDYLTFAFSGKVKIQDLHTPAAALAANSKVRNVVWEHTKANWDEIYKVTSVNMVICERYLKMALSNFASRETQQDIQSFFADKDCKGFDRGLSVVLDKIGSAAAYRERDQAKVVEWLNTHGYL